MISAHARDADPAGFAGVLPTTVSRTPEQAGPGTILQMALIAIGTAGVAGWLLLAVVHLADRYRIGHVQGHWMALAQYAREGILYPPLSDGVRFGGTRHMPLPIVVNVLASRLTGEYLASGKAVAIVLFATLLVLLVITLRQMRCSWPMAIALTGLLPATNTGVLVGSTPGGDVLPVVLQLGALLAVAAGQRRNGRRLMIAAGVLAGLAAASKLTGAWAMLAVASWLGMRRDWRRLGWFLVPCCATAALILGIVQWVSDGRFLTTFRTLTFAGTGEPVDWLRAPSQLVFFGIADAPAVWLAAPFAVLGVMAAWRDSTITIHHHALGWALLITTVVFTDVGAGLNQLLDPAVLALVAIGLFAARRVQTTPANVTLATAVALTVTWAGITGVRGFVPDLREAAASVRAGKTLPKYDPRPLARVVGGGDTLLAEDPGIPVLLGQTPVVLDAFMLRRLDETRPAMVDALVARIERGDFDHVATINALDDDEFWWQHYHFGMRIVRALRSKYVFAGQADGYYLYERRP